MKSKTLANYLIASMFSALAMTAKATLFVHLTAEPSNSPSVTEGNTSDSYYVEQGTNYAIIFKPPENGSTPPTNPASWTPYPWITSTQAFQGIQSIGMEIDPQTPTNNQDTDKVNIALSTADDSFCLNFTNTRYTGFAVKWPSSGNTIPPADRYLFAQWWQGASYHPPVYLDMIGTNSGATNLEWHLGIFNDDTGGNDCDTPIYVPATGGITVTPDVWHTFVVQITPDYNGSNGVVNVWQDGTNVASFTGEVGYIPNGYPTNCDAGNVQPANPAFNVYFGPYRNRQNAEQQLFFDDIRFADTYDEAVPVGNNQEPQVAEPTINPGGGVYTNAQTITISTTTAGASINYTTNGVTPSETFGTAYTNPVIIDSSLTLKAIAYENGMSDSEIATAAYVIYSNAPDFTLITTPTQWTLPTGSSTNAMVTVDAAVGFTGVVMLVVSGLPTGGTGTFAPASITNSGSSTLTVTTLTNTPSGTTNTLIITGTSGSLVATNTIIQLNSSINTNMPNFTLTTTPTEWTLPAGDTTNATVTVNAVDGFTGVVALTISGLPDHATGTFAPVSITNSGSSILTVTTLADTESGTTNTLIITGTSGSLVQTNTIIEINGKHT